MREFSVIMYTKVEYFDRLDFKDIRKLVDEYHPFDIIITSETYIGQTYDEETGDFEIDTYESCHIKVEMIFEGNNDIDYQEKKDLDYLNLLKSMME